MGLAVKEGGVYPRVCGGSMMRWPPQLGQYGLSPRVRGKPHRQRPSLYRAGSIPACAGEAPLVGVCQLPDGVYPRVCGGSGYAFPPSQSPRGLSPRVRGKLDRRISISGATRSIPACAGEA